MNGRRERGRSDGRGGVRREKEGRREEGGGRRWKGHKRREEQEDGVMDLVTEWKGIRTTNEANRSSEKNDKDEEEKGGRHKDKEKKVKEGYRRKRRWRSHRQTRTVKYNEENYRISKNPKTDPPV